MILKHLLEGPFGRILLLAPRLLVIFRTFAPRLRLALI